MRRFAVLIKRDDGLYGLLNILATDSNDPGKREQALSNAQRYAQGWRNIFQTDQIIVVESDNVDNCKAINNVDGFKYLLKA